MAQSRSSLSAALSCSFCLTHYTGLGVGEAGMGEFKTDGRLREPSVETGELQCQSQFNRADLLGPFCQKVVTGEDLSGPSRPVSYIDREDHTG